MNNVFSPLVVMFWVCLMLCGTEVALWLSTNQTERSETQDLVHRMPHSP